MNKIKNIEKEERPYERFLSQGSKSLTDTELLAILLRNGTKGNDVLALSNTLLSISENKKSILKLMNLSYEELLQINGIGRVKAIQILCLVELAKRLWRASITKDNLFFNSPKLVADYYMQEMRHLKKEELRIVFLDTRQRMIADRVVSIGTVNSSLFSIREILIESLKHSAVNILMVHNHPSGNPQPSHEDLKVTAQLSEACNLLGIHLNDHIIIGDNTYYSFIEQGAL